MRIDAIVHAAGHEIPLLLDDDGLPVPDANEWLLGRRTKSPATLSRNLSELIPLYAWTSRVKVDFRQRIESGTGFTEAEFVSGLIEELRYKLNVRMDARKIVSNRVFNLRLMTCNAFVSWLIDECVARITDESKLQRFAILKSVLTGWLDQSKSGEVVSNTSSSKALTNEQQLALAEMLHPKIAGLGRALSTKYRNFVAIMLMLTCGLRRGELLSLRVEDVTFGAIPSVEIRRRAPDPDDSRRPRPRVKRLPRTLLLDPVLAHFLDAYIMEHREKFLAKSRMDTPYLIVSDEGQPLSISRIYSICVEIRKKGIVPKDFSPHSLRHSFSTALERELCNAGLDEGRRAQALALLRGDTSLKSQEPYIAREIQEKANAVLARHQRSLLTSVEENQIPF